MSKKITTFFTKNKQAVECITLDAEVENEEENLEKRSKLTKRKSENTHKPQPITKKQKLEKLEIINLDDNESVAPKISPLPAIIKLNNTKTHYDLEDGGQIDYYPNYLPNTFSTNLFNELMEIEYEHSSIQMYGKSIKLPRVQAWMSDENVNASLYQKGKSLPWSENMYFLKTEIEKLYKFKFDYVLINLYRDGNDSISFHSDGESIGEGKNIIAGISLGATRKFVMRHNSWKERALEKKEFNLVSGSLIMMIGDNTQKYWKHSVPKTTRVTSPRINLTFRHS